MSGTVLLNNVHHRKLKVKQTFGPDTGANVNQMLIFPTEFGEVQKEYPILFCRPEESSGFQAVAILGLDKDENLFLEGDQWRANYIPALAARGPFSIALVEKIIAGGLSKEPMIHVNLEDPRINENDGAPVFMPQGGNSVYLNRINGVLTTIYNGYQQNDAMFSAFEAAGILEPVRLEVSISETEQFLITDYYTVSQKRLANLPADSLGRLNKVGFLGAAFFVVNSLTNISKLIEKKNSGRAEYRPS